MENNHSFIAQAIGGAIFTVGLLYGRRFLERLVGKTLSYAIVFGLVGVEAIVLFSSLSIGVGIVALLGIFGVMAMAVPEIVMEVREHRQRQQ